MARDIKDIEYFSGDTGEEITADFVERLRKKDFNANLKSIYKKLHDRKLDEVSIDDLELVMKIEKRNTNVMVDYKSSGDKYFIIKDNSYLSKQICSHTKAMIFDVCFMITHDNTLTTRNNIPFSSYKEICDYVGISDSIWKRNVSKDNSKFNIIKKEHINGKSYLVLNPLFSMKSRNITEYSFKCFYEELQEYLHPLDYMYLVKMYGIDPSKVYISTKQDKTIE